MRTLPDSLNYVGDLIDALKETDRMCEFLKNKINMWDAKDKEHNCQIHTKKVHSSRNIKNPRRYALDVENLDT